MKQLTSRPVSRREFMRLSAMATAGAVMVACAPAGAPGGAAPAAPAAPAAAEAPKAAAAAPGKFNEAPMLADLVKAGKLPAVDERLPTTPGVIDGVEGAGNYGGTIRRGFKGVSDRWGPTKTQDRSLAWYDKDLNIRARLAESWEVSDDAKEWTFHLRQGMKWSDGTPFTTEAVKYWYESELKNPDLKTYKGSAWATGAKNTLMELEVIDDHTFKFKFADANPLFVFKVSRPTPAPYSPGHYMKQFHNELTDNKDDLMAKVKAAGFETWDQYYDDRGWWYLNPERPSVGPWISKNPLSEQLFIMERNPYFFAVDSQGNQLPYVDKLNHRLFDTPDVFNLWITNGEVDFQARHVDIANYTLFKESEEKGKYKVLVGTSANHMALQLNQTTKNERLNKFFNNRDVRIAVSVAIDREGINDLIYDGLATPRQYSPLSTSPQYHEKLSKAYIEHDVAKANELLDGAGYKEKDADGFRKWDDGSGEVITFTIEGTDTPGSPSEDAVQQVIKNLAEVGIKAAYKGLERALYEEHWGANEIEAAWWGGDRTVLPIVAPMIFLGTMIDRPWADAWGKWHDNPADPNAQEPPADHWIRKIWGIWDQIATEVDADKRTELFKGILDIWAEELPMIGVLGEIPAPVIAKSGIHNYVEGMPIDDTTGDEHLLQTETYFWEDPENHA